MNERANSLLLSFDDASMYRQHNGLEGKAGPLMEGMLNGSTAAGCELLEGLKLDQQDYRVKFTRGTLTVYAYGAGAKHYFFVIHKRRPDSFVRGLVTLFERQAFFDLISTIQPPKQE